MIIHPIKTRTFRQGEDLLRFIYLHIKKIKNGDIVVVTSKIVALSQNRVVEKDKKIAAIQKDSRRVLHNKWARLTLRKNDWCVNAGADESNAFGKVILLPRKEFDVARALHSSLKRKYHVKKLGVILTDSRSMPLRRGIEGVALAYAGFEPLKSYIGQKDLDGRVLKHTLVNMADSLATASIVVMGEGNESIPLALIHGAPAAFSDKKYLFRGVVMSPAEDLYRDVYIAAKTVRKKK